ncbi:MAG: ABC transporter permease [Promethearchaeota archaeon]
MSRNENLNVVVEKRWQNSFLNLLSIEFGGWWKSKSWLVMTIIWVGVIDGFTIMILLGNPEIDLITALFFYGFSGGLFPPIAIILTMQNSIVGEKKSGTAEWVLSKPVSRKSFILAKWLGNSLNVFITMALFPGIVGYFIFSLLYGNWLFFPSFLLAITLLGLTLIFFVTFTLMCGTFLNNAGAVAGIPMVFNFTQQFLMGIPYANYIIPQSIYFTPNETPVIASVVLGTPIFSIIPIISVIIMIIVFLLISLFQFEKSEF